MQKFSKIKTGNLKPTVKKKWILCMVAFMLLSVANVQAQSTFDLSSATGTGSGWTWASPVLTVNSGTTITISGSSSGRRIVVNAGANVTNITLSGVTIQGLGTDQSAILLNSGANVTLTLASGTTNTLTSGANRAGIQTTSASLSIYGSGSLTANGGGGGAGIGGGSGTNGNPGSTGGAGGTITINSGTITATGGSGGAGIGGGSGGNGTTPSSCGSKGNKGGKGGNGSTITINGGTVTAKGGSGGAGIGGGCGGTGGTGANACFMGGGGAGGDGGDGGDGGTIIISGGVVTATSGDGLDYYFHDISKDGIGKGGGGWCGSGGNNYISGTGSMGDCGYPGTAGTLTMNGNGIVFASSVSDNSSKTNGILFNGTSGTFYGTNVTMTESVTIPNGNSLTIPEGKTLTIPAGKTLTNSGTIWLDGWIYINNGGTLTDASDRIYYKYPVIKTSATLPNASVGEAYNQPFYASGVAPMTWALQSGTLPAGLSLSQSGVLSGVPTACGTFNFTVSVTNIYQVTTRVCTLRVGYYNTVIEEGFESGTSGWIFENGNQTNKWIVGTDTRYTGSRSAYISNNNSANLYSTNASSIVHLYRDITFPTSSTDDFTLTFYFKGIGETNSDYMTVRHSTTSYTPVNGSTFTNGTLVGSTYYQNDADWSVKTITLPRATFSGTTRRIVFTWINNNNSSGTQPPAAIDNINIEHFVLPTVPTNIQPTSLPNGTVGEWYYQQLNATSTMPITWSISTGNLPGGLTLDSFTGEIWGTPTIGGTFTFSVIATNCAGNSTARQLSISIPKTVTVGTQNGSINSGTAGSATFAVTTQNIANGQAGTITWYTSSAGTVTTTAPIGISESVSNILNNAATVTMNATTAAQAGTRWFRVTIDGVQSAVCTLTVSHVPVTNISGVPTTSTATLSLTLTGTVVPSNATSQSITWTVQNQGTTGATISGNTLNTTSAGTVTVRATIVNGLTPTSNYTQNFDIIVSLAVLGGNVSITGNTVFGQTLTAVTTGLNSSPTIPSLGTFNYQWRRGTTNITGATNSTYSLVQADIGQTINVQVTATNCTGTVTSYSTVIVTKAPNTTTPPMPTMSSKDATSITLVSVSGCEYNKDGGAYQMPPLFDNLTPNTLYSFTQRYAETSTHLASSASASASFTTDKATLGGVVSINGNPEFGQILTAITAGLSSSPTIPSFGTFSYQWRRGTTDIAGATSSTYSLVQADIGQQINVQVTATNCNGMVTSANTATVSKAPNTTIPPAPGMSSKDATSITLVSVSGCEYNKDGGVYQPSPLFGTLAPNTSYSFTQRYTETNTHLASSASAPASFTTDKATLGGTVTINGNPEFGQSLSAITTYLSSSPTIPSLGTLSYQWRRGTSNISGANNPTYSLVQADIGQQINVQVTAANCIGLVTSESTAAVTKAPNTTIPPAPTMASKDATSITLVSVSGCEYNKDGGNYQTQTLFGTLTPNTSYSFTQRYAETNTHLASLASAPVSFITDKATLGGTITINGNAVFGETLTANTSLSSNPVISDLGTYTYQWKRNGVNIGTNSTIYTLTQDDIGTTITVTVTTANCDGGVTSNPTATVTKASQTAPLSPTLESKTATSITLNTISGCEYRIDGDVWQTNTTFSGLEPHTIYNFEARKAETATHLASPESPSSQFTTEKATQTPPSAPTLLTTTTTSITLNAVSGCEYNINGGEWKSSPVFEELTPNTSYSFRQRMKETETHLASPESPSAQFSTQPLGINENLFENITVFPNPTTGELRIETGGLRIEKMEIFDIYGRNVGINLQAYPENSESETVLNIAHLSVGVYFLKINTEIGQVIKKVLKE